MRKISMVCDNCGAELKSNKDIYHIAFESCKFTDAAGDIDTDVIRLDLCRDCCKNAVTSLKTIASAKDKPTLNKAPCNAYHPMKNDDPYAMFGSKYNGRCWGTREIDPCRCGGDRRKCDFYPEVREENNV